jgi:hypothetical protein
MTMKLNHGKVETHRAIWAFSLPVIVFIFLSAMSASGQTLSFSTSGGASVTIGGGGRGQSGFGNVNGLGIGTPGAGITVISTSFAGPGGTLGTLYSTPYGVNVTDSGGAHQLKVTASINTNFIKPTALALYSCPVGGSCGSTAGYAAMSTNSGAPTTIWSASPANGGVGQAFFGLWVSGGNGTGSTSFIGTDQVRVTYLATETTSPNNSVTNEFRLDTPVENVQDAVSLGFAQGATTVGGGAACALGGSVVVGSASDVSFNLGSVDGLGISSSTCGGKVAAVAVGATSATYATSYKVKPAFSGITTSATPTASIVLTSSGFTNSGTLTLKEGSSAAAMSSVPISGNTHTFTTTVSNVAIERFIGLTILNNNSGIANRFPNRAAAGPFTASADAALVTFTMTVN